MSDLSNMYPLTADRHKGVYAYEQNFALPCIGPPHFDGDCTRHVDFRDPMCCTGCSARARLRQIDEALTP